MKNRTIAVDLAKNVQQTKTMERGTKLRPLQNSLSLGKGGMREVWRARRALERQAISGDAGG